MPELPEVETLVLGLRRSLLGQKVGRIQVLCDKLLQETPSESLNKARGGRVLGLSRRGKFLLFHLSNGSLMVFHLRMTGKLLLVPSSKPLSERDRMRLDFAEGDWALAFEDQRKFGSFEVIPCGEKPARALLGELGPDALQVDAAGFRESLKASRRPIKSLLLDQRVVAGLGNIYVDECLHRAGVHPRTPANAVPPDKVRRLRAAIRSVLRKAIACGGSSVSTYRDSRNASGTYQVHHRVYRREGQKCRTCGGTIRYVKIASRGTRFCPSCQKAPAAARRKKGS